MKQRWVLLSIFLIGIVFLSGCIGQQTTTPTTTTQTSNQVTITSAQWGYKWGGQFPQNVQDCRWIEVKLSCNAENLYGQIYLDGNVVVKNAAFSQSDCIQRPLELGGDTCIDASTTHMIKICWSDKFTTTDFPNCNSIALTPYNCKNYNETCSFYSFPHQTGTDSTDNCCGKSNGLTMNCVQSTGNEIFTWVGYGSGICKRLVCVGNACGYS